MKEENIGVRVDKLFALREKKAVLADQLSAINTQIEELQYLILTGMEEVGLDRLATASGSVTRSVKLYPRIDDFEMFLNWVTETGRSDMIQRRPNAAPFREYFEEHNEYPEGLDAFEKATLHVRRS